MMSDGTDPPGLQAVCDEGLALHRAGRLGEAAQRYGKVLSGDPGHFDALRLLGMVRTQSGRPEEGVALIRRAIEVDPEVATAHASLGAALSGLNRPAEAVASLDAALALKPDYFEARFHRASALRTLDRRAEALADLDAAVALNPASPEAHDLRAIVLNELGRSEAALESYDAAVALRPAYAEGWNNRGALLNDLDRPEAALASLDRALALKPDFAEAHYNRAMALDRLKRPEAALASYDRAIALKPDYAEALANRGLVLADLQRPAEALASFNAVAALRPADAEAWNRRAIVLGDLGRHEEALESIDRALALQPDLADAHYDRSVALVRLNRPDEALESLDAAIALAPDHACAHHNRGSTLGALGRPKEALASFDRAIALKPDYAEAFANRGLMLRTLQRLDEALESYHRALALDPANVDAHVGKSFVFLLNGQFEIGWREHEWRKAGWDAARRLAPERAWSGEGELAGKRLFLEGEQGLGDVLQFVRYVDLLAGSGADITLAVQAPLRGLIAAALPGVAVLGQGEAPPDFDYHCALMSLPLAFGTTLATIPPPLRLRSGERRAEFAALLGPKTRPRVGLAWSGNPAYANDRSRSMAFETLTPLLGDDIEWIAVQNEIRPSDAAAFAASGRVAFFGDVLDDFTATAALVELMDLVIRVDTSLAHLAGSLGKPVWILLPFAPDWRWLLGRPHSPGYPTARLFRQPVIGDGPVWSPTSGPPCDRWRRSRLPLANRRIPTPWGSICPLWPSNDRLTMMSDGTDPPGLQAVCDEGLALHRAGRLGEAAQRYGKVLSGDPGISTPCASWGWSGRSPAGPRGRGPDPAGDRGRSRGRHRPRQPGRRAQRSEPAGRGRGQPRCGPCAEARLLRGALPPSIGAADLGPARRSSGRPGRGRRPEPGLAGSPRPAGHRAE